MYLSGNDGNNISENKLRDLYNREKALENWTNKVNTQLKEPDRSDVLMLVEHLKEQEKSALWIMRYLSAILLLRNKLPKPFRYCSKSEIKELLEWMKTIKYKKSTHYITYNEQNNEIHNFEFLMRSCGTILILYGGI